MWHKKIETYHEKNRPGVNKIETVHEKKIETWHATSLQYVIRNINLFFNNDAFSSAVGCMFSFCAFNTVFTFIKQLCFTKCLGINS